jgi:hypothetical protein
MNGDNGANAEKGNSSNDDLSNQLGSMRIEGSSRSSSKKKKDTCLNCLKEVEGCSRCSKCRTALYCNRACQLNHWPVHKNICQDSNNAEDNNEKLEMKAMNHFKQGNLILIYNIYHY